MSVWLPQGYREVSELEVKRSRFLTTVARVEDEAGAREVVAEVRRTWPDARHHCTAFIVEMPGAQPVERSSDDGEPSGTAGRPMLDVLDGAGLVDVAVVVVRYFGGVLLGTGGLVRAYSDAVGEALARTPLVRPVELAVTAVDLPHAAAAKFENEVRSGVVEGRILDVHHGADVVRLRVAAADSASLTAHLAAASSGRAAPQPEGTVVVDLPA